MAEQPRNLVSTVAERYELVERIAVGGMAEVFRAKKYGSHGFAKQMAVKRILPSLAANDEFVTRFIAEAKIAVTLSHANIVQVFDFSRFADSLYIAMEFVDGADLAEVLKRCRKKATQISVAPALHVAMELLKGLDFAHSQAGDSSRHFAVEYPFVSRGRGQSGRLWNRPGRRLGCHSQAAGHGQVAVHVTRADSRR